MDTGTGLTVLGICAVVTAAILRMPRGKSNGEGVLKVVCDARFDRVLQQFTDLKSLIAGMGKKLDKFIAGD